MTQQSERAIAVLERASSPRWPTIIIEMTCKRYCARFTVTIGPANQPNLLSSAVKVAHVRDDEFGTNKLFFSSMSFSVSLMKVKLFTALLSPASLAQTSNMRIWILFIWLHFPFQRQDLFKLNLIFIMCRLI